MAHRLLADIGQANPEMARNTLHNHRSLLSGIFRSAIQQGYLEGTNPIRESQIPRAPEQRETHAYSLPEVFAMLRLLPNPARVIVAVAAFLGLRRSEIMGLEWGDYSGDEIRVNRSIWEGETKVKNAPKTKKSAAPVPVIVPLQKMLDDFRLSLGSPTNGPMFASANGKTPRSLNNVLNRSILPVLNVCIHCGKPRDEHGEESHEYERNPERPQWHGWHGFRRSLATNLHSLAVPDKEIQTILRHSNISITQSAYIKVLEAGSIRAMRQLESVIDVKMLSASSPESHLAN